MNFPKPIQFVVGASLLALACAESISFPYRQPRAEARSMYLEDKRFGEELDRICPGQILYSIPPMSFPEDNRWMRIAPYDNLRPWLHTRQVSFSFGQATNKLSEFDAGTALQIMQGFVDFGRISRAGYWGALIVRRINKNGFNGALQNDTMDNVAAISPDFILIKFGKN